MFIVTIRWGAETFTARYHDRARADAAFGQAMRSAPQAEITLAEDNVILVSTAPAERTAN